MNFSSQEIPASPSVFSCVSCGSQCRKICLHDKEVSIVVFYSPTTLKQESTTDGTDSSGSDITPQPKRQRKSVSLLCYMWLRLLIANIM